MSSPEGRARWEADYDAAPSRARSATRTSPPCPVTRWRRCTARPTGPSRWPRSAGRGSSRSPAACTRPATAAGCGPSGSSPGSATPSRPTGGSATSWPPVAAGSSVAFDMPTLMGRDSDDPLARGEVGHCGVAIDSRGRHGGPVRGDPAGRRHDLDDDLRPGRAHLRDVRGGRRAPGRGHQRARRHPADRHLQGVHRPEGVAVRPRAAPAPDRRPHGVARRERAEVQAAERVRATTSGRPARRPRRSWRSRSPTASGTSSWACRAAWTSTSSPPGCRFFFDAHIDFFEEIAKFRAARRIWARWLRDEYGATTERAQWLRFHTQTAGVSLTAQQPDNNIVRTAIEALAAVLGGTNSLHTNALDEVLALPSEKAAQIALRTQQVIAEETGVANVADPLGGSWYVEALTDRIEAQAEAIFAQIRDGRVERPTPTPRARSTPIGPIDRDRGSCAASRTAGSRPRSPTPPSTTSAPWRRAQAGGRRQLPRAIGQPRPGDPAGLPRGRDEQVRVLAERRAARDDAAVETALDAHGRGRPDRRQPRPGCSTPPAPRPRSARCATSCAPSGARTASRRGSDPGRPSEGDAVGLREERRPDVARA